MKVTFVKPRHELKPYIESFWVLESPSGLPASDSSIAAPNGCSKLIIPYENSLVSQVHCVSSDEKKETVLMRAR